MNMNNISYGIPLLDDLHTYFPDLLYNTGRFRSIQDVLLYIREVAINQSPFHIGHNDYIRRNPDSSLAQSNTPPSTPPSMQPIPPIPSIPSNIGYIPVNQSQMQQPPPPPPLNPSATPVNTNTLRMGLSDYLRYFPLLSALSSAPTITIPEDLSINLLNPDFDLSQYLQQPVEHNAITRPTRRQINAATTVSASIAIDDICAICQEDIESGAQIRKINSCRHTFHKSCIDVWFDRSVCCPVCRIDIRDNLYSTDVRNAR
jgi:hypothetical protein